MAQLRSYPDWAAAFAPLDGILGKVLGEERTDTVTARNLAYFTQFKSDHPDKAVLLHFNGRARLPSYRTAGWFAGDWLYNAGTSTAAIALSDTTITVESLEPFSLAVDAFGNSTADLVLTGRLPDGTPDFATTEQVILTATNAATSSVQVVRGAHGTAAIELPAGGYLAQHLTTGPYTAADGRLWMYNFATDAPRGADGLSVVDRIIAEFTAYFARRGALTRFDGIELDIFTLGSRERANVDSNGDGTADAAIANSQDLYRAGQIALTTGLKSVLGARRILAVDGDNGNNPDPASVGGIEIEGFPKQDDDQLASWSGGIGALERWRSTSGRPQLTYPLAKTSEPLDVFARFRITLAAALLTGSQFTFWDEPGGTSLEGLRPGPGSGEFPNTFAIWDELVRGADQTSGWLGPPSAAQVCTALASPDLLAGHGTRLPAAWVAHLVASNAQINRISPTAGLAITPSATTSSIALAPIALSGPDFSFSFDARAVDDLTQPPAGRMMTVTISAGRTGSASTFVLGPAWTSFLVYCGALAGPHVRVTIQMSGTPGWSVRRITAHAAPDTRARAFHNGAVLANPSAKPATFDIDAIFPGARFTRLTATPGQDPRTNDGTPISGSVEVPAQDALVVMRVS